MSDLPTTNSFQPASSKELAIEINKMFLAFPSFNRDADNHKLTISTYVESLLGLPLLAVQMGRGKVVQKGGAFPPSAGDFRAVCVGYVPRKEPTYFGLPQPGPEPEPEPDPRVGRMMRDLANDLARKAESPEVRRLAKPTDHDRDEAKKAALERLAELQEEKDRPLTISPYLAAQLRGELPIGEGRLGPQPVSELDVHIANLAQRRQENP